jgi:membrane protease YdiL (CAAX protease family)
MKRLFKTATDDLRWGWKTAILIIGTLLFGILFNAVVITVLTVGYSSQGLDQAEAMEQATAASGGFVAQVLLSAFQLGFMLWLVRWLVIRIEKQKFDWAALGLVDTERSKHILLGLSLAVGLSLLTIGLGSVAGTLKFAGNGFDLFPSSQVLVTLLLSILLAFTSGFGEEVAFRGYLQSRIARRYNPTIAVLIVAVLFALSHPLSNVIHPLLYLATAILVGILFGTIFARTGSLWMGIALHALWNYLQIAVFAIYNAADERFFGAPLFVFEAVSGTMQAVIELGAILAGSLLVIWRFRPVAAIDIQKENDNVFIRS